MHGARAKFADLAMLIANSVVWIIAAAVIRLAPAARAHAVFWQISEFIFPPFVRAYRLFRPQSRSEMWRIHVLQRALSVMTRHSPGFDLKLRVLGKDLAEQALNAKEPLIICTAHFGLTLAAARVLADLGHRAAWVTDWSAGSNGWHWGLCDPLKILVRGPNVMLQVRRELERGTLVVCYVDYKPMEYCSRSRGSLLVSPNAFSLAHRVAAHVLFMASHLEDDGTIVIEFQWPWLHAPRNEREAERCAADFAAFLSNRIGWRCFVQRQRRSLRHAFDRNSRSGKRAKPQR